MTLFRAYAVWWSVLIFSQAVQAGTPVQHWVQPTGAQVFLAESAAIPVLDVQLDFDAGSRLDPPEQAGLTGVTALMMSKGLGTGKWALDESEISNAWADVGGAFRVGVGLDRFSFSLRTLTEPDVLKAAVALASCQMAEPAFLDAVWLRERVIAALQESNTRPATVAARAFGRAVFDRGQANSHLHAVCPGPCAHGASRFQAQRSGLLCAAGRQSHSGRWRFCVAPDRRGETKAWLELQRVQPLRARLACGAFTLSLQTRPDQAAAKTYMVGGFALRLDSNRKLLDNLANMAWYGLPLDYLDTWTRQVDELAAGAVREAFQRHLKPDELVTVVVGPSD